MKLLFALLGVALAAHSSWPQDRLFKSQTEYRFRYEGSVSSGVSLPNSEKAITRHRSDVTIQILDDKYALLQLKNVQLATKNVETSETSELVSFDSLEKQELSQEHKKILEHPVRFHFRQGLASELQFSSEEPVWSANMKRAIISMVQLNWEKLSNQKQETEGVFFTEMEKSVEGECEVAYNVLPEFEKILVTKSINFDKCERRMELAYNQRFGAECPECQGKLVAPHTVYSYKIEKQQLKEVELNSVYSVNLEKQPLMRMKIQARLTLEETSQIRRQIETPKGEKQEIIYSSEYDYNLEDFLKKGDESMYNPMTSFESRTEIIEKIVKKLSDAEIGTTESAEYFMRLVQYLRLFTEKDLVHFKRMYENCEPKIQSILLNALAVAGTKNTISYALRLSEKLPVPKVLQLIKSIQETPFPSEEISDLLMEFIRSEKVRRHPVLEQATLLAYGVVVRGAIGDNLEKHGVLPSEQFKSKVVEILNKQLKKAENVYQKVVVIKTFANAGIDESVTILEKIIQNKQEATIVRVEAIDALRMLSEQMPRKIHRVLMPVYSNRLEKNEIRMAALRMLVQAKPTMPELSQVVLRMEREPNQQVAAFTYHVLAALAESSIPCHRNTSTIASTLLRTSQYRPDSRFFTTYKHLSAFNWETLSGLSLNMGAMFGKNSAIPKDVMASFETVLGGYWSKYLTQVGFSHQNIEALYNKVLSKLNELKKRQQPSRASRLSQSVSILKDIARQLNLRTRESSTEEPYAMLYIRYKQMDYAVLPIDDQLLTEVLKHYIRNGAFDLQKIQHLFNISPEFEFSAAGHILESIVKVPCSLGFPVIVYNKQPTTFGITGKLTIEKTTRGLHARIQAQPKIGSMHFHSLQVWTPLFTNGVKHLRTAEINTPIDIVAKMSMNKEIQIELSQKMPEDEKVLLRLESRPVAFVRYFKAATMDRLYDLHETTISAPKMDRLRREMEETMEIQGLEVSVSGLNYHQWDMESVLLGEQRLQVSVKPTTRTPKELTTVINVQEIQEGRIEEPKIERMLMKEMNTEEGEWEPRSESNRREHLSKYVRDMELKKAYKHHIRINFSGNQKTEVRLRTEVEPSFRFIRLVAEVEPESRREWNLKSEVELVLPRPVSSLEQLKDQKHREVQIFCETKWGSEEKNSVEILAQLEQSKMQRNLAQQPRELRGLPAHEQLSRAARLNQLKARVNYKLSRQAEKTAEKYFDLLKAYTFWSSQTEVTENEPRRLTVHITSEPVVPGFYNLTVQTPKCNFRVKNVELIDIVPTISRQPKNFLRHAFVEKAECKIQNNRVNTFEDVVFRAPLSTCYTVVAKDCSEEPRYAVLVKNVKKNSEEKMVKIIYDETEYELEMTDRQLKASVNGKAIRRDSELEEYKIEQIGDLWVVDLGELVIRFDGYTVKILLNNSEMDNQCGLCGNPSEQKDRKYRTAKDEETDNLEEFHRSFTMRAEECSSELSQKKMYKEYSSEESASDEDYEWSESRRQPQQPQKNSLRSDESEESDNSEPVRQTIVKEVSNKLCFSLEAAPQCPKRTIPQKNTEKTMNFGCLPRNDDDARRMEKDVRRGKIVDIESLDKKVQEKRFDVYIPKTCLVA